MKNLFAIVMLAIMVLTVGCSKNAIQKEVDEWNKELPKEVDDGVVKTKVEYDESQDVLVYYYDIDSSAFESSNNDDSKKYLKQFLASECKNLDIDVKKYIFEINKEDSDESFTIEINKSDIDNLAADAERMEIQALVDRARSGLPMQMDAGVEWTDISYDSSIGQVVFTYTMPEKLYNYINSDSTVTQDFVDDIVKSFGEGQDVKELNVQSYLFRYNTDNGKSFSFTKTWSEIFE